MRSSSTHLSVRSCVLLCSRLEASLSRASPTPLSALPMTRDTELEARPLRHDRLLQHPGASPPDTAADLSVITEARHHSSTLKSTQASQPSSSESTTQPRKTQLFGFSTQKDKKPVPKVPECFLKTTVATGSLLFKAQARARAQLSKRCVIARSSFKRLTSTTLRV